MPITQMGGQRLAPGHKLCACGLCPPMERVIHSQPLERCSCGDFQVTIVASALSREHLCQGALSLVPGAHQYLLGVHLLPV